MSSVTVGMQTYCGYHGYRK